MTTADKVPIDANYDLTQEYILPGGRDSYIITEKDILAVKDINQQRTSNVISMLHRWKNDCWDNLIAAPRTMSYVIFLEAIRDIPNWSMKKALLTMARQSLFMLRLTNHWELSHPEEKEWDKVLNDTLHANLGIIKKSPLENAIQITSKSLVSQTKLFEGTVYQVSTALRASSDVCRSSVQQCSNELRSSMIKVSKLIEQNSGLSAQELGKVMSSHRSSVASEPSTSGSVSGHLKSSGSKSSDTKRKLDPKSFKF